MEERCFCQGGYPLLVYAMRLALLQKKHKKKYEYWRFHWFKGEVF
jgi:hypothetical protein